MIQTENNTDSIEKIVAILYQVSAERTLYRDIKDYNIPVHKLGSRLYFYWEEVEQSLSREKV